MAPLPVSVGDIITICTFLKITISNCLSAADDQLELYQVLTQLDSIISLLAIHMDQYILYTDQLQSWYSSFEICKTITSKLHKSLMPDAAGMGAYERVKYATLARWGIEKQMATLKEQVENLRTLDKLILRQATKKDVLRDLRSAEKHVRAEAGLLEYEGVVEDYSTPTRFGASESSKTTTQTQIGKASKLSEKFLT